MSKRIILPLGIDGHVHARDMEQSKTMSIMQTCIEAKKSGIGVLALMPNTSPSIDNPGSLHRYLHLIKEAEQQTGIKCYVWIALTDNNHKSVIHMLKHPKVIGVKIYPLKDDGTSVTTGAVGIQKWQSLMKLLGMMQRANIYKPIAGHWEDPALGHTVDSEVAALKKLVILAKAYKKFKFVACHLTSKEGLNIISNAQKDKLDIMIEMTPHHLWFCSEEVDVSDGLYKCFPPIKSCIDRTALRNFIKENKNNPLISIGSDTAPHSIEAKNSETPPRGLATEQHIIPVILSLKDELGLDENDIANLISNNSANFLEIDTPKGSSTWELTSEKNVVSYNNGNVYNPFYDQLMVGQFIEEGESDEY